MMHWFFKIIFIVLLTVITATAGSLDAPAPPDSANSAMHTLDHLYNILATGDPDQITMRNAFEEPKYGPVVPSGIHDLDEIYSIAPKFHENAATELDVIPGKYFWGLGKNGGWGLLTGSPEGDVVESRVLKTGQTIETSKYDEWNSENHQDDAYWANQGVGVNASNVDGERFKVKVKDVDQQDDGTVMDQKTGLMWVQNPLCWSSTNCHKASMTWDDAFVKVKALDDLPLGCTSSADVDCYTDWRLPNIKELQSLIDYGHSGPALPEKYDDAFTENSVNSYYYWSSTTNLSNPFSSAWAVYMVTGMVTGQSKSNPCYVWPVRDVKK
jgi:hypothetical protein